MRVLFISNYPSPYRVDFFNLLGKHVDLTVAFTEKIEAQKHRSLQWFNKDYSGFKAVFLNSQIAIGKVKFFKDIIPLLKSNFDHIILGGYTSGTQMIAIEYMKMHKMPFTIEADGGFISAESRLHYLIKRHFISSADSWLSSGKATALYFKHYGAKEESIFYYPFTSQRKKDLELAQIIDSGEKGKLRKKLGINEPRMVLFVGQMIHRKGIDILLKAAQELPENVAVVIVGAEPTEEYLEMWKELKLKNVYFVGFKVKDELAEYYEAADLFVMPTREDIWGLVINEAMSYGLPIVSTDRCVAALELVENNVNGMIVPVENPAALAEGILQVLASDMIGMGRRSRLKIQNYTIENMVEAHVAFFKRRESKSR